jgi:hypothetical protein
MHNLDRCSTSREKQPYYEHGFWWWFDGTRGDWFVGSAPYLGRPSWAAARDAPPRKLGRVIYSSRYEPPEYAPYREPDDPDGEDSRD